MACTGDTYLPFAFQRWSIMVPVLRGVLNKRRNKLMHGQIKQLIRVRLF